MAMKGTTYKEAGVDIDAGDELVRRLKKSFPHIGGFGGLYPLGEEYLVAGCDGVGTKLKLAFATGLHGTVGIDLVAMCANDVVTAGAKPLFFLDYFATSKLDVDVAEAVIAGIAEGCREAGALLLGGETAEMPGFYRDGEYDLSGFCVGSVHRDDLIDGSSIELGDKLVALPSSGIHSNGFSLVNHLLKENGIALDCALPFSDKTLGELLLQPTRIYVREILQLAEEFNLGAVIHITGGGIVENVPRLLPKGLSASVDRSLFKPDPLFSFIQQLGEVTLEEMYRTFNMGVGMVVVMKPQEAYALTLRSNGYFIIGEIVEGEGVQWM